MILFISLTMIMSCSKDDDSGNTDPVTLDGVPTGEIVARNLSNETLTGFSSSNRNEGSQKWWTHITSDFNYVDCGDDQDFSVEDLGYYAFYPDGTMHSKSSIDGTPNYLQEWEWTDSNLTAIYVRGDTSVAFTVTYLNDDNAVYGANQSLSGPCSIISYEQLGDPHYVD
ncbi:MAG: hypothetical protein GYB35_03125 [Algicola sp.]|nr:hypothetical protein [Algicola sp.]